MAAVADLVVTGPFFQQKHAENLLVAALGQPNSSAVPLGKFLAGTAATFTPVLALTAMASGNQSNGTPLTGAVNTVTTVGSANDSVLLPLAAVGLTVVVINGAASNSMQVFGAGTDTINGVATATGVAQAAGKTAAYYCTKSAPAGAWFRLLSA